MENNNILQSPDINKDWTIDKNDVNELISTLSNMTFNEKKEFVSNLNNSLWTKENEELMFTLKDVFEKDLNVLNIEEVDSDLYLLYQTLFLVNWDIKNVEKKVQYFSYKELDKDFKNQLSENGIDKKEYEFIINKIGIDELVKIVNNGWGYRESYIRLIINYNNFSDILNTDILKRSIYIDIKNEIEGKDEEVKKNILDKIKIITKYTDINDYNIWLIRDENITTDELDILNEIGNIDYSSYMQLKDMWIDAKHVSVLYEKYNDIIDGLTNKWIQLSIIIDLINNNFPFKEYGVYLNKDNALTIDILYNRSISWYNKLTIDEVIWFSSISSLFVNPQYNISLLEENNNILNEISKDFDNFKDYINTFQDIFWYENVSLYNIIILLFYVDYSKLLKNNISLIDLYKNEHEKYPELSLLNIIDKFNNLSLNKENNNWELNNSQKKENIKEHEKIVFWNTDLFNRTIVPLLWEGQQDSSLKKVSWWVSINADKYTKEYIKDILSINWLEKFLLFLEKKKPVINIEWKQINILKNIQFIKDILEYKELNSDLKNEIDFSKVIELYSKDLNEFLDIPNKKDTVFVSFQVNQFMWWDEGGAFLGEKWILKEIFKNSEQIDLSITSKEKIQTPDEILKNLELILKNKPNKEVIFYIWVHWWIDGSASYSWWNISKDFFDSINELANKYPNFKAKIDSCYSWAKIDSSKINWNIYATSENETATWKITNVLEENKANMDYNKDWKISLKEVAFTEMLYYNESLLWFHNFHSFVKNKNWNIRKIAWVDRIFLDTNK